LKDKDIEIIIYEVDETTYLLKSETNRQRLMDAKSSIENQKNLVEDDCNILSNNFLDPIAN